MVAVCIKAIKNLVLDKELSSIKSSLQQADIQTKGLIFEQFLEFLYAGNGWLVSLVGGRSDAGADLLLYHPSTPSKVSFIIQAKNHKTPLTFDDTKIELIKFEDQAKTKYQCNNYKLISINGFVENAKKLETFGMGLYSWTEIEKLILNYKETPTLPSLELVAHNKLTNTKINNLFKTSNKVSVIQATGTGKSYLIGQSLIDNISKQCLVLAPSIHILQQQEKLLPWLDNVIYMTYAKAANFTLKQWQQLNAQFIVMDEFHRAGADTWGKGVQLLIKSQPKAKYLGTTATHIRFLDSARNMADELFDNVIANELSLQDAIAKEILPSPFYISALYQLKETIADYKQQILACKATEADKEKSNNELESLLVDWETSSGVPDIFNKHLTNINGKFIIFCESVEHLNDMSEQVRSWFKDAAKIRGENIRRYDYVVHSQLSDREVIDDLSEFENADNTKGIHLLFSVNMLNEGLHIKGVNGVVLLRKTTSPIVYFQQIGRCLQVDGGEQPVIFDLVNNINNIQANTLEKSLKEAVQKEQEKRSEFGLSAYQVELHISDEILSVSKALEKVRDRLHFQFNSFEFGLQELIKYKEEFDDCLVPRGFKTNIGYNLGHWVGTQRTLFNNNQLDNNYIKKLDKIGFEWDVLGAKWNMHVSALKAFNNQNGTVLVPAGYLTEDGLPLGNWVGTCRKRYKLKELSLDKVNDLLAAGFIFEPYQYHWNNSINELSIYISKNGNSDILTNYKTNTGFCLGTWLQTCRTRYKNNKLEKQLIKELELLGVQLDLNKAQWQQGINALKLYKNKFGDCMVPRGFKTQDQFNLSSWVNNRRVEYQKNRIPIEQINELNSLDFIWEPNEIKFMQGFEALIEYKREHDDLLVHMNYVDKKGYKLGLWVSSCRKQSLKGKFSTTRIEQLNSIGFIFDAPKYKWEQGIIELNTFYVNHGHSNVTSTYIATSGFKLGNWVAVRKRDYANNKISQERINELRRYGFNWL